MVLFEDENASLNFQKGKCYFLKYLPLPYDMSLEILTYQNNNYI